ncbi:MAG: phosphotransferase family protein [Anaerolinea sp.]|nr:phosphotransferase family protein [Anaerolinea sp.]
MTPEILRERLAEYLTEQIGVAVTIETAAILAGGASRDMWVIDAVIGGGRERLVLRRDLPTSMHEGALTRLQEFRLMQLAYGEGVRVARPRFVHAEADLLDGAFFLMDYVEGIAIGRKVVSVPELAEARRRLPDQMAEQLARIHQTDPSRLEFLRRPPPERSPAHEAIAETYEILDRLNVSNPAFEYALRWADRHAPTCDALTLVHGDFRIGNLIVNPDGLAAVADWEFAHWGDPDEELGYLCMRDWRFGMGHLRMGGISDREPFLQAYERYSGRTVNRAAVDFWELLGNIRWGVICLAQANRHLSGRDPSVELASLGRRSAEMQYEMLNLIAAMEG